MVFENFENILSLLCTIVGLLYCFFKYIETPRRGYRFIIAFFLASFLSEYYWTIYELVMGSYPDVSGFAAYLGWNVAYLCLLLAVFFMRSEEAKTYHHPVILLPVLITIPQFILYIRYGGILNNLWQVGITSLTLVFCMQEFASYMKHKREGKDFPGFSLLVVLYMIMQYGMWTASCFSWDSELSNPYLYCSVLGSLISIFFVYGAGKYYASQDSDQGSGKETKTATEMRFQVLIQIVITLIIMGICVAGYFTAAWIKNSLANDNGFIRNEGQIVIFLFMISAVLILIVLVLLLLLTSHYRRQMGKNAKMNEGKRSTLNFIFTIVVTLALMVFAVVYNNLILYNASVISVYEDGEEEIKTFATELENYLTVASTTLRVAADSVDLMEKNGSTIPEIRQYILDQTKRQAEKFDENFTGIYAYINGQYLDGLGWVPPTGYEPTSRDWYKAAVEAKGETVIVSPYVDAQTGSVVITIAKCITETEEEAKAQFQKVYAKEEAEAQRHKANIEEKAETRRNNANVEEEAHKQLYNVVALDVIVNHIKEVTQEVTIAEKGYGMVVNTDGFIIAHRHEEADGKNIADIYDQKLLSSILNAKNGRMTARIDDKDYTLFVSPVMDQWYSVIVISNTELFEETWLQLAVNILVSLITFCLISFFYYIGYKNEQIYGKKVEEMNIQVVSALATAIDAKDKYTNGHSSRVAEYSRMIAARSGYSRTEQDEIYMMGLLHDVGKIGVPDSVINKPSRLTDEEFVLIKKHPVIGNEILESIKERPKLATGARWHHERYGGGGYPDGIAGEDIPEEARIIAVADAYDAMTSRRSYRDVMPQDKVRSEIEKGMGTQFDPQYAKVMLQMIDEDVDYTMREK